ncbi:hypothetical protein Acr_01g0009280 [Actinidia rufa]|uniref:Uncharacterized protein n=1 Tax=Actinidia rufa TaxID=165716 RepID=A0A7J0E595_9ERIC|nr:hypothetical protein Acr_01g0009280 [Actinidia rufa]
MLVQASQVPGPCALTSPWNLAKSSPLSSSDRPEPKCRLHLALGRGRILGKPSPPESSRILSIHGNYPLRDFLHHDTNNHGIPPNGNLPGRPSSIRGPVLRRQSNSDCWLLIPGFYHNRIYNTMTDGYTVSVTIAKGVSTPNPVASWTQPKLDKAEWNNKALNTLYNGVLPDKVI